MTEQLEFEQEYFAEETVGMSSIHHSLTQARLTGLLTADERYIVATELSLDVSSPERQEILARYKVSAKTELVPDIVLYHLNGLDFFDPKEDIDLIRIEKMPLLCIEIASPSQSSVSILSKLKAYFAMGVKSCWYVDPALRQINIYSHSKELNWQSETFVSKGEVYDKALEIRVPLEKIFFSR